MSAQGIHHVTAITGDPQKNVDFYAGFLGLRLVKKTVNFDDPDTYHLYYGDELGRPGTIMTFFPWPGARRGRRGNAQVAVTSFAIPRASLGFWLGRLLEHGVPYKGPQTRFEESFVSFEDADGLALELVAHPDYPLDDAEVPPRQKGPVPPEHALRGFHGVTLWEEEHAPTAELLTGTLGFRELAQEGSVYRYRSGSGPGAFVDVRAAPGFWPGAGGVGTVHHVAFRTADDNSQLALREALLSTGLGVTPQIDRQYFKSVYFREPGGVLFEAATDPPGFTADESAEALGTALKLPPRYEGMRARLTATLPPLQLPGERSPGYREEAKEAADLDFVHRWLPGDAATTLLLLHGTGGNENDLIALGRALKPGAAMLSPRGKVLEDGMPRFFRRLREGVFDEEDLKRRAGELAEFIRSAASAYGFSPASVFAVGYSNGANIASSVMLLHPGVIHGAVLLRPMVPFEPATLPDLANIPVFIGAGRRDPIVPVENTERLVALLKEAGSAVTLHLQDAGHTLSEEEIGAARRWLASLARQAQ